MGKTYKNDDLKLNLDVVGNDKVLKAISTGARGCIKFVEFYYYQEEN